MPHIAIDYDKEKLGDFCRKWKITEFSLFGSVVRDDFGPESVVDVLVTFEEGEPWSLFSMVHIQKTRPLTLGYAVADSPAGLGIWIWEKFREWADPRDERAR